MPGSILISRLGAFRVLLAGTVLTAVVSALRGAAPDAALLFAATFAMGVGIAIMHEKAKVWWPDWRSPVTWRLGIISGGCSSIWDVTGVAWTAFLPAGVFGPRMVLIASGLDLSPHEPTRG